nr:FUSC family protein [Rhizobium sp. Q54]
MDKKFLPHGGWRSSKATIGAMDRLRPSEIARYRPVRIAAQTAGGAASAYLAAQALGLPEPSWSVFSALFVIQSSVGGTIRSAMARIGGGAAGLIIGLIVIFAIGIGGWLTVLALSVGVAITACIASLRSGMSYALVTVTMLVLAPGIDVIEGAFVKALEIGLGSLCGAVAVVFVLPRSAHRQADEQIARSLEGCAELLTESYRTIASGERRDVSHLHDQIEQGLQEARSMSVQSRPRFGSTDRASRERDALRREAERLWYTLALIERLRRPFQKLPVPAELLERETSRIDAAAAHLRHLAAALLAGTQPQGGLSLDCSPSQDSDNMSLNSSSLSTIQAHQLFALSFADQEISNGIAEVANRVAHYLYAASR